MARSELSPSVIGCGIWVKAGATVCSCPEDCWGAPWGRDRCCWERLFPAAAPTPLRSRAGWGSTEAGMGASSPDRAQAVVLAQLRCRR